MRRFILMRTFMRTSPAAATHKPGHWAELPYPRSRDDTHFDLTSLLSTADSYVIIVTSKSVDLGPSHHLKLDVMAIEEAI
jgi:hypothetical protein